MIKEASSHLSDHFIEFEFQTFFKRSFIGYINAANILSYG